MIRFIYMVFFWALLANNAAGFSVIPKKMVYGLDLPHGCKYSVNKISIKNDGKAFLPFEPEELGKYFDLPMTIPKDAFISWQSQGKNHSAHVPLRSLLKVTDVYGRSFIIIYEPCGGTLNVTLEKSLGGYDVKKRLLWSNQKLPPEAYKTTYPKW